MRDCYAVIFTSQRKAHADGYDAVAEQMAALSRQLPGFIDMEHARREDGSGYWGREEAIAAWKRHANHKQAQRRGAEEWYTDYNVRIAKVIRAYAMSDDREDD